MPRITLLCLPHLWIALIVHQVARLGSGHEAMSARKQLEEALKDVPEVINGFWYTADEFKALGFSDALVAAMQDTTNYRGVNALIQGHLVSTTYRSKIAPSVRYFCRPVPGETPAVNMQGSVEVAQNEHSRPSVEEAMRNKRRRFRSTATSVEEAEKKSGSCSSSKLGYRLCVACDRILPAVRKRIVREAKKRESAPSINEPLSSLVNSPTRAEEALRQRAKQVKVEKQRVRRLLAQLHLDANGLTVQPGKRLKVINEMLIEADPAAQKLFDENAKDARENLQQATAHMGFDDIELARTIWNEAVANAKRERTSGARSCRYSPVTIKFAICLRAKCGEAVYDTLRKVFHLPTDRRLQDFHVSSCEDLDGIMHGILAGMAKLADEESLTDW